METQTQSQAPIEELNYLTGMGEKAEEILKRHYLDKKFAVSKQEPFPSALMEGGARILIDVAVVNTPLRAFHVIPLVEKHLYLLNVQDKSKNTVADVIFVCENNDQTMTVQDILVTYKPGAVMYRYEELATAENQKEFSPDPS